MENMDVTTTPATEAKPTRSGKVNPVSMDPSSQNVLKLARLAADSQIPVVISGESGVGKEVIARYIHDNSDRADKPFVAINCAAIPENMLEASLFGYEKGAFTGAHKEYPGKFEQAQGSTLLLDEISEMPLSLQAKLLRVLQEKEVERIGSTKVISLDVRVIATTNRDLKEEISDGAFREDLYYRLNVFPIHWQPLRERPLDVIPMAQYLLARHSQLAGRTLPTFSAAAKQRIIEHSWPGNTREMDNVIQRALILQTGDHLDESDLLFDHAIDTRIANRNIKAPATASVNATSISEVGSLKQKEYQFIIDVLNETRGNRTVAAKRLNISPRSMRYKLAKMREIGMQVPAYINA
jgi:two-component system response regulator FlrC